jgi:hypothetical protein
LPATMHTKKNLASNNIKNFVESILVRRKIVSETSCLAFFVRILKWAGSEEQFRMEVKTIFRDFPVTMPWFVKETQGCSSRFVPQEVVLPAPLFRLMAFPSMAVCVIVL